MPRFFSLLSYCPLPYSPLRALRDIAAPFVYRNPAIVTRRR
jgi:hypothetical protein